MSCPNDKPSDFERIAQICFAVGTGFLIADCLVNPRANCIVKIVNMLYK